LFHDEISTSIKNLVRKNRQNLVICHPICMNLGALERRRMYFSNETNF